MTARAERKASRRPRAKAAPRRSAARLAAVQALYQIELSGAAPDSVIAQFTEPGSRGGLAEARLIEPDPAFFADLVRGVAAGRAELDRLIAASLTADWELDRLEIILRLILEAGVYEIKERPDVPPRVAITEYVDMAHAFFDGATPGFVNGILDRLARSFRPREMPAKGDAEA
ncbi:MAG: transcription antitermination factor NusB [Alphaproteobacteria bacterium]